MSLSILFEMRNKITLKERCLEVIKDSPGLSCSEIAHVLKIKRFQYGYQGLSGTLAKLAKAGLVERREEQSSFYKVGINSRCWRYYPNANA